LEKLLDHQSLTHLDRLDALFLQLEEYPLHRQKQTVRLHLHL
jgi:hypothetical protein